MAVFCRTANSTNLVLFVEKAYGWRKRRAQPISPLEGEMPGRAEGGIASRSTNHDYRFNSHVVTRSPVAASLPSFN